MLYEEFIKNFGKKVKFYRKNKKWNQLEMALELDIHPNDLSNIECGRRNITLKTVKKIADSLHVQPKDLLDFE